MNEPKNADRLEPCPFCGRPALIHGDLGLEVLSCSDRIGDCPGSVVGMPCHTPQRRAASIAAWNTRAGYSLGVAHPPAPREPLTEAQRESVFEAAARRMRKDINLSWRNAIVDEVEREHGIGTDREGGQ